jgi:protein sidekick
MCLVLPAAPRNLAITNIQPTAALLQFEPGFSGYTSITTWIVQSQKDRVESASTWMQTYSVSDPDATAIMVQGLRPYTSYRLRIVAVNIAGHSDPSKPTLWFDTLKAVPSIPPSDVTVRAWNETALLIRWMVNSIQSSSKL